MQVSALDARARSSIAPTARCSSEEGDGILIALAGEPRDVVVDWVGHRD